MKLILLMLLAGCLSTILGCSHTPVKTGNNVSENQFQFSGKYLNAMSDIIYIELKDDGTFCHKFGKRSKCGKYTIDGNRVIFDSEPRSEFKIEGNMLISKEGARFIKQ